MASVRAQLRRGTYYDSVVLMQLQKALLALVADAGVVMGTAANKELIRQSGLFAPEVQDARPEDLVIAVKAETESAAISALNQVDDLLTRRAAPTQTGESYRPHGVESAIQQFPQASWVLISVPGRYAAGVARESLRLGRNVFLYSDNVPLEEEIALKQMAGQKGLLVLGPDCGTAIVNGAGLGFANRVRRGNIGVIGASGTGLQAVTARIHALGHGVSQAIGTGTHDLWDAVGAVTTRQALELLQQDPSTAVIVLISKPPSPAVAAAVLDAARTTPKPIVVDFIGYSSPTVRDGNLYFAPTLSETAERAIGLLSDEQIHPPPTPAALSMPPFATGQRYLRGLYSGGTLAYEAQLILRDYLSDVYSNAPLDPQHKLTSPATDGMHVVLDIGADEFTVGRLHPMLDHDLRIRMLRKEAEDAQVAVILLDVVLGYGAHPDPAGELAPAIAGIRERAAATGRALEIIAVVIGTDQDPQGLSSQAARLQDAGARVELDHAAAVRHAGSLAQWLNPGSTLSASPELPAAFVPGATSGVSGLLPAISQGILDQPFAAINVGLESFYASLRQQDLPVIQVDWRPPAGGNEKLIAILERLKHSQ